MCTCINWNIFLNKFDKIWICQEYFPNWFDDIVKHTQNLSSIQRMMNTFERDQSFACWCRKFGNHEICWKLTSSSSNGVWQFKIVLLMQNWRFVRHRERLVQTACLLESNAPYDPGHVGWPPGCDKCISLRREQWFLISFTNSNLTMIFLLISAMI